MEPPRIFHGNDHVSAFTFSLLLFLVSVSATFKHVEVCHVSEVLKVMDDEQRARIQDDHPPDLGGMSLAEVGLAYKSRLLAPPAASVVNFVSRHGGLERVGISKDILTFPLSFCPTAAEISLSLEAVRAQLGQAEGAEASLDEYIQEAGLESMDILGHLGFELRVFRPARRTALSALKPLGLQRWTRQQFKQQSTQVLCLYMPTYISRYFS